MARLTTAKRRTIPKSQYGLPAKAKKGPKGGVPRGAYPMPDVQHARTAKVYASREHARGNLSGAQFAKINAKANRIIKKAGGHPTTTKKGGKK